MRRAKNPPPMPSLTQMEAELARTQYKIRYGRALRSTLYTLITVAAIAILIATLWLPVLQIYGSSMTPTLQEGEIVLSLKDNHFKMGDIVAFYFNNKILVKRVIAGPGQWVDIKEDGTVYVDKTPIDEPYVKEKARGECCNIKLPYQVPDSRYFVIGDHRETSVDSRSEEVGCVADEQIVGRIVFCVWPLNAFGAMG